MTVDEAKVILAVWRPDGSDSADPAFHDALDLARKHPDLLQWLHEQQEFDLELSESLHTIHGPAEGRQSILAQAPVIIRDRTIMLTVRWLVAAALLLVACLIGWQRFVLIDRVLPDSPFDLADAAEHLSIHHKEMEFYSDDLRELRAWLARRDSPVPESFPGRLSSMRGYGCQDWRTNRGPVSLVCLYPENSDNGQSDYTYREDNEWVHFFVFGGKLARLGTEPRPRIVESPEWVFIVWNDAERAYALGLPARAGARERLQDLLRT